MYLVSRTHTNTHTPALHLHRYRYMYVSIYMYFRTNKVRNKFDQLNQTDLVYTDTYTCIYIYNVEPNLAFRTNNVSNKFDQLNQTDLISMGMEPCRLQGRLDILISAHDKDGPLTCLAAERAPPGSPSRQPSSLSAPCLWPPTVLSATPSPLGAGPCPT